MCGRGRCNLNFTGGIPKDGNQQFAKGIRSELSLEESVKELAKQKKGTKGTQSNLISYLFRVSFVILRDILSGKEFWEYISQHYLCLFLSSHFPLFITFLPPPYESKFFMKKLFKVIFPMHFIFCCVTFVGKPCPDNSCIFEKKRVSGASAACRMGIVFTSFSLSQAPSLKHL